ncbi:type II CRISPR-associated endonuclease Cas1 [Clostridium bornimense]|uniref:type II CRISPR-associated endonuclease Cas1 n=1 Tax=Clostridium bornimense TaxID=1216932 RepID=UPI001C1261D5|nr:type II CRISPR-associated endonuclease Cas1 [Clostridium bornimense]MBU5317782.1 type II CRISPR-associated endonuclease Cas1 [Clostridium bornimense]
MSFRSVIISNPATLTLKNNNLIINTEDQYQIPIEDITVLVIETVAAKVSSRLLSALSENNVATVLCDEKHLPSATVLPLNKHHRTYKVLKNQLNQSAAFSKRIWQSIVKKKLYNQGRCLELCEIEGYDYLMKLSQDIESGDKGNKEAIGAKYYFPCIFGHKFTRDDTSSINSALNYGYSIIRSAVARTLVMYGFNPALGVNHCNELNSFNLADDFMEPLRPIVDLWVYENISDDDEFTREHRIALVDLVNHCCIIENQKHSILNGIDKMIASYTTACSKKDFRLLKLPEIIPLEYHYYE